MLNTSISDCGQQKEEGRDCPPPTRSPPRLDGKSKHDCPRRLAGVGPANGSEPRQADSKHRAPMTAGWMDGALTIEGRVKEVEGGWGRGGHDLLSSHSSEPGQAIKPAQTRQRAELEFVTAAAEAGRLICSEKLQEQR